MDAAHLCLTSERLDARVTGGQENLRCAQVSSARVPAARLLNVFVWKTLRVSHTPTGAPLRWFLFSRKKGYPPPSLIQARASVPHAVGGGLVSLLRCGRAKREPHGRPFRQSATLAQRRKKIATAPRLLPLNLPLRTTGCVSACSSERPGGPGVGLPGPPPSHGPIPQRAAAAPVVYDLRQGDLYRDIRLDPAGRYVFQRSRAAVTERPMVYRGGTRKKPRAVPPEL